MKTEQIDTLRIKALASHLDCDPEELTESRHADNAFEYGRGEYLVLTDEEADAEAKTRIRESLWAFNASFILSECDLPFELEDAIASFQQDKCEDANDAIEALVEKCCEGGVSEFADSAISADGRGHFIAQYDGEENEETVSDEDERETFYIYRVN